MMRETPTLHLLCGKMAAGKSTLAAQLAGAPGTVLISLDVWLDTLFGDQMSTPKDFVVFSTRLRNMMGPHVTDLLNAGTSVVLDFPANTRDWRDWMRGILDGTNADHVLHVLAPPDEVCLARLKARNESGDHPFQVTEAQYWQFAKYFEMPDAGEGFTMKMYGEVQT